MASFSACSYYSKEELIVLLGVVFLGAGRTTLTKVYFQMGYDDPFFATVLVLLGHSMALPAFFLNKKLKCLGHSQECQSTTSATLSEHDGDLNNIKSENSINNKNNYNNNVDPGTLSDPPEIVAKQDNNEAGGDSARSKMMMASKFGSATGLNQESADAVQWIQRIPYWAKPLITSIFGLSDAVFRVSSVLFLPASIADMLITGLELFFIIVAQKIVRKRFILRQRWIGSGIVIVGLVVVTCADFTADTKIETESFGLGLMCVLCKVVSGVGLDMSQELFTQESNIPAILLLGMEAVCGLLIFIPLYFATSSLTGFNPVDAFEKAVSSPEAVGLTLGLLVMLFIAGIFQILGTAVTSSMTRNLWITSFRGPAVWIIALATYYIAGNGGPNSIGEPWYIPGSFIILTGVIVIFVGVRIYYYTGNIRCDRGTKALNETDQEISADGARDDSQDIWV